MELVLRTGPFT